MIVGSFFAVPTYLSEGNCSDTIGLIFPLPYKGAIMKKVIVLSVMMNFVVVNGSDSEKNSSTRQYSIGGYPYMSSESESDHSDGSSEENDSDDERNSKTMFYTKKWNLERKIARIQRRKKQLKILKRDIMAELDTEGLSSGERFGLLDLLSTVQRKQLNNAHAESIHSMHNWTQKLTSVYAEVESTLLLMPRQGQLIPISRMQLGSKQQLQPQSGCVIS
jgi:hypothetical protein